MLLVLIGGCGRVGFESTSDRGGSDGGGPFAGHTISAQTAYLKASNTDAQDRFGFGVAISADGTTLAASADLESSAATGIDGNQADNSAPLAGAAYVFTRTATSWDEQAYVKASNTNANDVFGFDIALAADGNTLAVSAPEEASAATGINGNQASNAAATSGAVYVFVRSGKTWTQEAYVKASNTGSGDRFGSSVALSADGSTLAVGATSESSAATGVGGDQSDNSSMYSGAAYVFVRSGTTWAQQAYVKASNTEAYDNFGGRLALSSTGDTLAVYAGGESSAAVGVNGNEADNSAYQSGAVYVFARSGTTWAQQAYVKASNTAGGQGFGVGLALSGDGNVLAAGAPGESSAATGIGGNQSDTSKAQSGAVYVFGRSGTRWSQLAYVKASNPDACDNFGVPLALSSDAGTLAVSAIFEASASTGVGGDQASNAAIYSGAVYVFR